MIKRIGGYLTLREPESVPPQSLELESEGGTVIRGVLNPSEVKALTEEIDNIFETLPADNRTGGKRPEVDDDAFRYEMLNRSPLSQAAVSHPLILEVIEPLLGDDCHVIANTAWRNAPRPNDPAQAWHIDAGPHVPLPLGVEWPENIPHPVFAIGVHLFLKDCTLEDGPTGFLPQSHLSGRFPPFEERDNPDLMYKTRSPVKLIANAGDAAFFVSDVWHRRLPTGANDQGRYFLQIHYGRRDIAQRIRPALMGNQLSDDAIDRAGSDRARSVIGLHPPFFYDG